MREPKPDYMLTGRGPQRAGESVRYGTVSPIVREALEREGVIEVAPWSRANGISDQAVATACKREVIAGRAVSLWSATFHPALAEKMIAAVDAFKAGAK